MKRRCTTNDENVGVRGEGNSTARGNERAPATQKLWQPGALATARGTVPVPRPTCVFSEQD